MSYLASMPDFIGITGYSIAGNQNFVALYIAVVVTGEARVLVYCLIMSLLVG